MPRKVSSTVSIDLVLHRAPALASIPAIVQDLIFAIDRADVPTAIIARLLAEDQALSAKLLRLANSAYYKASRTIGSVDAALRILGFRTVRTLVLATSIADQFKMLSGFNINEFWQYSAYAAAGARYIATVIGIDAELAFTIGLLHAIGRPIMHNGLGEALGAIDKVAPMTGPSRVAAERAAFGFSYENVGAELLRRWNFPAAFPAAMIGMAVPIRSVPVDPLQGTVHIASWLARSHGADPCELVASWPEAIAQGIGLDRSSVLNDMPALGELSAGLDEVIAT